jgi:hypothetical protein
MIIIKRCLDCIIKEFNPIPLNFVIGIISFEECDEDNTGFLYADDEDLKALHKGVSGRDLDKFFKQIKEE